MAGSFTLPTVLANLTAGNQALSLIDGDLTTLRDPLLALGTFANYYTDTGAANAYAITVSSPQTVALAAGLAIQFKATNANTGASTLQINALATKNILTAQGTALAPGQIPAGGVISVIYDGTQFVLLAALPTNLPRSDLAGLAMTNGTDAVNDIDFSVGEARDSTNAANLIAATAMTKQLDAAWAAGTNAGGRMSAAAIANTTYFCYAIRKDSDGTVDFGFDTSATAPTMPSGYTYFRRIGAIVRSGATILAFVQQGDLFQLKVPLIAVNTTNPGTAAVTATLPIPVGINVLAWVSAFLADITTNNIAFLLSDISVTDNAPDSITHYSLVGQAAAASAFTAGDFYIRTNTSAQIRYRLSLSGAADVVRITAKGWTDRRGRDD